MTAAYGHFAGKSYCLRGLARIVHPQYRRAALYGECIDHRGSGKRFGGIYAEEACEHRLARQAHEQRTPQDSESIEARQHTVVLIECLGESEARIHSRRWRRKTRTLSR